MNDPVLRAIRARRVVRRMTADPVGPDQLEEVLAAAARAPSAGNRRLQRFVVVDDPLDIRLLRMVSPGMIQHAAAIVVICIDWRRVDGFKLPRRNRGVYVDVGAAMQTMLLAAHAIGLGAGPVASFSRAAVREILGLPDDLSPEILVCLGHPAPDDIAPMRRGQTRGWREVTDWERPR